MIESPLDLALACRRSYERADIDVGGTQVLIEEIGASVIVAPRGTERDFRDILTDIRGVPWPRGELGWTHKGFGIAAERVWPVLVRDRRLSSMGKAVHLTGHSLGGALAVLLAAQMLLNGYRVASLVTFGAPRAGWGGRLGRILAGVPGQRFVNGRDGVPSHPWAIWGYRHDRPETAIGAPPYGGRYLDHRIGGYIDGLSRLAGGTP